MFAVRLFPITIALFVLCFQAQALSNEASTVQVRARLIASVDAVHPGDVILAGVHQNIIPHWHTYWKNPGDSGLPTSIEYTLPPGATAGEIQWPTPGRITLGPVTNYGYDNEVTLLSTIRIPKDIIAGSIFSIKSKVKWLVCKEECIPQQVELSLDLPVILPGTDSGRGSPLVEAAQATLPVKCPWQITLIHSGNDLVLGIFGSGQHFDPNSHYWFFPDEWGKIAQSAEQTQSVSGDSVELRLKQGDTPLSPGTNLTGILAITENKSHGAVTRGYVINAINNPQVPVTTLVKSENTGLILPSALLLAFLGGIILNLMPCVFPVLSIKALALIKHAQSSPRQTKLHGWAYTLGILSCFLLLGATLIALKSGGIEIGWGFQFQSPLFVLSIAYLMFAVGLSLSGVFTIGSSIMGVGSSLTKNPGYSGSFFTGVLATIVATPCTAPFMAAALGFALTQSPFIQLTVFTCLGFGLALPYLILSHWPSLQHRLPKPGAWMDRLKQGLAFPMYTTSVWLVWVLAQQSGINSILIALGGMVIIAFAAWVYENTKMSGSTIQLTGAFFALFSLVTLLIGGYAGIETQSSTAKLASAQTADRNWETYTAARLKELRATGKPVFLNFTAAWCISCLVNEKVALSQQLVIDAFKRNNITYLKGDWTNRDPEISRILAEFGRSGVPLYLYYPPGISTSPVILPQILTPEIVSQIVTGKSSAD